MQWNGNDVLGGLLISHSFPDIVQPWRVIMCVCVWGGCTEMVQSIIITHPETQFDESAHVIWEGQRDADE